MEEKEIRKKKKSGNPCVALREKKEKGLLKSQNEKEKKKACIC